MKLSLLDLVSALLILVAACAKAYWITSSTSFVFNWNDFTLHFAADYALICPALALITFNAILPRLPHFLSSLCCYIVALWYAADTLSIILVGTRLHINDIKLLLGDLPTLFDVVPWWMLPALLVIPLAHFIAFHAPKRILVISGLLLVVAFLGSFLGVDRTTIAQAKYYSSFEQMLHALQGADPNQDLYTVTETIQLAKYRPEKKVAPPPSKPNIVLVIVESLSAIDSKRVAGVHDRTPRLDRLSQEGMLFKNLVSNHTHSAGGVVALFHGVPPIPFPGAGSGPYQSYQGLPSIPRAFRLSGYWSGILFAVPEEQLQLRSWATTSGFDYLGSPTSIAELQSEPRFVINSVSDEVILQEASSQIEMRMQRPQPFLFSVVTNSSHAPFEHPEGGPNTEDAIWNYVDQQLNQFYQRLKELQFFENGILLITGDHRKRTPVTDIERQMYGDSAHTRSYLVAIGRGLESNKVDDRFLQHSDILRLLPTLGDARSTLSEQLIFVDQPGVQVTGEYCQQPGRVFLASDQAKTGYAFCLEGSEIDWLQKSPDGTTDIESKLHAQRSYFQSLKSPKPSTACQHEFTMSSISESGVDLSLFHGEALDTNLQGKDSVAALYVDNLAFKKLPKAPVEVDTLYHFQTILKVTEPGTYYITLETPGQACVRIGPSFVLHKDWVTEKNQWFGEKFVIDSMVLQKGEYPVSARVLMPASEEQPYFLVFKGKETAKQSRTLSKTELFLP